MMKYLIFVAFLLATANAFPFNVYKKDEHLVRLYKRATTFTPCPKGSPIPLNVTTDADPVIGKEFTATIVFITDKDYPKLALTTTFTEDDGGKAIDGGVTTADLCKAPLTCPVAKGQQVTLTAKTAVPDAAKLPYDIEFNVNDGTVTVGCSTAKIVADGAAPPAGAPPGGAAPAPAPAPADGGKAAPAPAPAPADGGKAAPAPADGGKAPPPKGPAAAPAAGGPPPPGGKAAPAPADGGKAPPPAAPADGGAGDGGAGDGGAGDGGAGP